MQNVSRKYKESMKEYIRNRGYIRAVIGIINSQAQRKAKIDLEKNELLYISNLEQPCKGR